MEPTFGERLRGWLAVRGMKPAQLARAVGVSRPTMHAWLHSDAMPRGHRMPAICEALGVTQAEFHGALPSEQPTVRFAPLANPIGMPPPPAPAADELVEDELRYDLDPPEAEKNSDGEAA